MVPAEKGGQAVLRVGGGWRPVRSSSGVSSSGIRSPRERDNTTHPNLEPALIPNSCRTITAASLCLAPER